MQQRIPPPPALALCVALVLGAVSCGPAERSSSSEGLSSWVENRNGDFVTIANLTGSEPSGYAPYTVYFDATNSYSTDPNRWINEFRWDFGDGTSSSAGWVAHTFENPGEYFVHLIAYANAGQGASVTMEIHVLPPEPPTAVLDTYGNTVGPAPLVAMMDPTRSFAFPGDANNWIDAFEWDFDDGSPISNLGWVEHPYAHPGSYRPKIKVTDGRGLSDIHSTLIQVGCSSSSPCNHVPGQTQWSKRLVETGHQGARDLANDSAGNLVTASNVSLFQNDTFVGQSSVLAKHTAAGALLWELEFEPQRPSLPYAELSAVEVGPEDEIWVSGSVGGTLHLGSETFQDEAFWLKLSPEGEVLATFHRNDFSPIRAVGEDGSLYGILTSSNSLFKMGPDGTEAWRTPIDFGAYAFAVDGHGNLVLGGEVYDAPNEPVPGRGIIAVFSTEDGAEKWRKRVGSVPSRVKSVDVAEDGTLAAGIVLENPAPISWAGESIARPVVNSTGRNTDFGALLVGNVNGQEEWGQWVDVASLHITQHDTSPLVAIHPSGLVAIAGESPFAGVGVVWAFDRTTGQRAWYRELGKAAPVPTNANRYPTTSVGLSAVEDGFALFGYFIGSQDFGTGGLTSETSAAFLLQLMAE